MNNLANDPSGKKNKIYSKPISTKNLNKKKLKRKRTAAAVGI